MQTQTPSQTAVQRWSEVTPSSFKSELQSSWQALDTLRQTTEKLVENDQITPVEGIGILACASAQIFGYQAFHGNPSVADLYSFQQASRNNS